jgi:hypothetical protein
MVRGSRARFINSFFKNPIRLHSPQNILRPCNYNFQHKLSFGVIGRLVELAMGATAERKAMLPDEFDGKGVKRKLEEEERGPKRLTPLQRLKAARKAEAEALALKQDVPGVVQHEIEADRRQDATNGDEGGQDAETRFKSLYTTELDFKALGEGDDDFAQWYV